MEIKDIWAEIIRYGIATESELLLVTNIIGYSEKSLNNVIYARTGYQSIDQILAEDDGNEDE